MNDRPHNKNLEDLLKNLKADESEGLDDFDREALDGFETLGSEQNALDIKSKLDNEIHAKLFTEEKKSPKIYWFAAAGLFLVIGLTVLFILNNRPMEDKNVAIIEQQAPQTLKEETNVAPPAEEKSEEIKEESAPAKTIAMAPGDETEKERSNAVSSRAILNPAQKNQNENTKDIVMFDNKSGENDKDDITTMEAEQKPLVDKVTDEESKKVEEQNKIAVTSKTAAADNFATTESRNREELKKEYKSKEKASKKKSSKDVTNSDGKLAVEKSAEEPNLSGTVTQTNSKPDLKNNNAGNGVNTTAPASANGPGDYRADDYNSPTNPVFYTGGEDGLSKDIRQKLITANADKKFDVILVINEKKAVEKVNFLNVYDLTVEEKNKITEILKALNQFNFYIQPNTKGLFEYKLKYRP